jgi:hypothetical protein
MGSAVSKVIGDTSNAEDAALARDTLNALRTISVRDHELFHAEVTSGRTDDGQIPIDRVVFDSFTIRAKVSKDVSVGAAGLIQCFQSVQRVVAGSAG